ncbi:prolyl 4-hydroxylase subunit alpha-1-like [Ochlerotatus camptorhynchus]|uniref:prolyl 4-hydroxylase subunit alpha-1-like n=1 Tax=Ochlerotatus camptorhynchus TaxID=644619 RepID=UPI0031D0F81C
MAVKSFTLLLLGSFFLLSVQSHNPGEYYSSVANLEYLLESERSILQRIDKYISLAEEKSKFLKRQKEQLQHEIKDASKDPIAFLSNPINAFLLMKRLVKDYKKIDDLMQMGLDIKLFDDSTRQPSDNDYSGIVEAMAHLQDLYKLEAVDLARGEILGQVKTRELASDECYAIGVVMSKIKQFRHAISWLREALRRWAIEPTKGVSKFEILDYLSYSLAEEGDYEEALKVTNQMLKLDSKHEGTLKKLKVIEHWLEHVETVGPKPKTLPANRGLYEPLCRGEYQPSPINLSKLRCRYESSKTPFIRIAPFKMEEASLDPLIVIYHDAISDKEVDKIIDLTKPTLSRSMVGDSNSKEVSKQRTSQNGWLADTDNPLVKKISVRTVDMTGLDIKSFESLQVNNYGIGGFYLPHYDWVKTNGSEEPYKDMGLGNRIATLMFYLSDVEQGGATVFPNIGVGMFPKKGSAIFWYNLLPDGTGDERTLHGACPVLTGSKWVANKWIHEYHQEFRRPCDLHSNKAN